MPAQGLCRCIFLFGTVCQGAVSLYVVYLALCARGLCPYVVLLGIMWQGTVSLYFFIWHSVRGTVSLKFFIWHCVPGDCVPIFFYLALCARGLCP